MVRRTDVTGPGGVRLATWEFGDGPKAVQGGDGGSRPCLLLLHGLMGRASTWAQTAEWLVPGFRTVALDQRGHGHSDKPDGPYSREAYIRDAETVIEQLGLGPAVVVGHSMGALTAWQLAARRPDLVRGLVLSDMRASAYGETSQREWWEWFASWPLPFDSLGQARRWFAEDDPALERPRPARGDFFVELMHDGEDGYRPGFSFDHMLATREPWVDEAHWEELAHVTCPALVVRALDGDLGRAEAQEMVRVLPHGRYAEIPDAGHLLHYEQPTSWRQTVEPFLRTLVPA
ncbi:alpha/beta fold hydrolase [Wenjunlia tyrosinilytica]|uniref:Alpha/beta hydrolase n=1 Tax=Wenjunlia tyrosinilytica TaxID=1544741 RepID=A0A917ZPW1_9ACTN|nr:alpha/beta hydrolase [Wenjunlia tyrosinilytica]GGO86876.1 alpha/beta hydrolase [Wenjunlia tyrosinilytica]